jgi:2'-5' RNA ligase
MDQRGSNTPDQLNEPMRRVFFGLWPDESLRSALAAATREPVTHAGGRAVPAANFHVTLTFLGSVPDKCLARLGAIAETVANEFAPPATDALWFDHLEYWKKAKTLCAVAQPNSHAAMLSARLRERALAANFSPDLKPFRPHVTLARKVTHDEPLVPIKPIPWRFTSLALLDSRTLPSGAIYSVVNSWALAIR